MIRFQTARLVAVLAAAALAPVVLAEDAAELSLGSEFTYRGRLQQKGEPAEGTFDVIYDLYDARRGGTLIGSTTRLGQEVRKGLLQADLDFGHDAFADGGAWLEIRVRPAGNGPFTALEPRQKIAGTATVCTVDSDVEVNGNLSVALGSSFRVGTPLHGLYVQDDRIFVNSLSDPELLINPGGGKQVGIGVAQAEAPLSVTGSPDANLAGGGAVIIGSTAGPNIALDSNEIMARNGGSAAPLYLNHDGGTVYLGGSLSFGYELVVQGSCQGLYIAAACSPGKHVLGGGCGRFGAKIRTSFPSDANNITAAGTTAYTCAFDGCDGTSRAYAICANVE